MKKWTAVVLVCLLVAALCACSKSEEKTVMDVIKSSAVAKLELPNGTVKVVDSEVSILRTFAALNIAASPLEPADNPEDWIYRIVFNPSEYVKNSDEVVVSFHEMYVQIGNEFYLGADGVPYESILEWAESKFDYFMK